MYKRSLQPDRPSVLATVKTFSNPSSKPSSTTAITVIADLVHLMSPEMMWGACIFGLFLLRGKNENSAYPPTSWQSCDDNSEFSSTQTRSRSNDFALIIQTRPVVSLYALPSDNDGDITDNETTPRDRRQLTPNEELKVKWLQERLSLTDVGMKKIRQRYAKFAGRSIQDSLEPTLDWLQSRLGLNDIELAKFVPHNLSLLGRSRHTMESKLQWFQTRLHLSDEEVAKMVKQLPAILTYSVQENLEPKAQWLQTRFQLSDEEVGKLMKKQPSLLSMNIQKNLEPKAQWLQTRFQLSDEELGKVMKNQSSLLSMNIQNNLEPTIQWLENRLDLDTSEKKRYVSLLSRSVNGSLEPNLRWIQERFDLDDARLKIMVRSFPKILNYSIETMARKVCFYSDILGEEDATKQLENCPSLLSCSLERRVQPRLAEIEAAGLKLGVDISLGSLARYTDERWSEYLARRLSRRSSESSTESLPVTLSSSPSSPSSPSFFILDVDSARPLPLPPSMANIYPPLQSVPCKVEGESGDDDNNGDSSINNDDNRDSIRSESQYLKELIVPPNVETLYDFYVQTNQDDHDPSWAVVWPTAISLTNYLLTNPSLVRGKRVVELGAGVGLVGLTAATLGAKSVVLTDREPLALHCAMSTVAVHGWNSEASASSSFSSPSSVPLVSAGLLNWEDVGDGKGDTKNDDVSSFVHQIKGSADVVVASDVLYDGETIELFAKTCQWLLADEGGDHESGGGIILVTDPKTERFDAARDLLLKSLGSNNFDLEILDLPTPEIDANNPTPKTMDGKDHLRRLQEPTVLIRAGKKKK